MSDLLKKGEGVRGVLDSTRTRPVNSITKKCTQCKDEKSLADFIKMGISRHSMCDPCRKAYTKKNNDKIQKLKKQKIW
ncbi:hypothetical protein CMO96_00425 [Candidatus Woesebacteria bacterium]|nr:hypothetical protein [Candidatus Woesebacteria bacterium]|tara:strand:- start:88 stop:321 length:234 start_codon:yes stop_codon:yes gene_type:complete